MVQGLSLVGPLVNFGYKSAMKHVATNAHAHCAYGGEELNSKNPATAEHIKPHSAGGPNIDYNFLPVCEKHNNERGHIPLDQFVKMNPKIWENIKKTILEMRNIITDSFNGPIWAKKVKAVVEHEAKKPLEINVFA